MCLNNIMVSRFARLPDDAGSCVSGFMLSFHDVFFKDLGAEGGELASLFTSMLRLLGSVSSSCVFEKHV